jgi:hypothetical protein
MQSRRVFLREARAHHEAMAERWRRISASLIAGNARRKEEAWADRRPLYVRALEVRARG